MAGKDRESVINSQHCDGHMAEIIETGYMDADEAISRVGKVWNHGNLEAQESME